MPVILRTADNMETWLTAPAPEALRLQQSLPDKSLCIVATAQKRMASLLNSFLVFAVAMAASARMYPERRVSLLRNVMAACSVPKRQLPKPRGDSDPCIRSNL